MSKFFVGQRVRVNDPTCFEHGTETVVQAIGVPGRDPRGRYSGVEVELRNEHHLELARQLYPFCVFRESELEPITDRNELVTWESCAWSPHGVRA